eukprot:tig00000383_g24675.t1
MAPAAPVDDLAPSLAQNEAFEAAAPSNASVAVAPAKLKVVEPIDSELLDAREAFAEDLLRTEVHHVDGNSFSVQARLIRCGGKVRLAVFSREPHLVLHWGVSPEARHEWALPDENLRPEGTVQADSISCRVPLKKTTSSIPDEAYGVIFTAPADKCPLAIHFSLTRSDNPRCWYKCRGLNFSVRLRPPRESPLRRLRAGLPKEARVWSFGVEEEHHCDVVVVQKHAEAVNRVELRVDRPGLVLHWGLWDRTGEWRRPPEPWAPAGSKFFHLAAETAFPELDERGVAAITLEIPVVGQPQGGLCFVLRDAAAMDRWIKNSGGDFAVELPPPPRLTIAAALLAARPGEEELSCTAFDIDGLRGKITARVLLAPGRVRAALSTPEPGLVLHWGVVTSKRQAEWVLPPQAMWPRGATAQADKIAVRTGLLPADGAEAGALHGTSIETNLEGCPFAVRFVLTRAAGNCWYKHRGGEFFFRLQPPRVSPLAVVRQRAVAAGAAVHTFALDEDEHACDVTVRRNALAKEVLAIVSVDRPDLVLHWGVAAARGDWRAPAPAWIPEGGLPVGIAAETPFPELDMRGIASLPIRFPLSPEQPRALVFVFRDKSGPNRWIKASTGDGHFFVELPEPPAPEPAPAQAPAPKPEPALAPASAAEPPKIEPAPKAAKEEAPEVSFEALEAGPGEEEVAGGLLEIDGLRGKLTARLFKAAGRVRAVLSTPEAGLVLHWGVSPRARHEWVQPPAAMWPRGTAAVDALAVRTPFAAVRPEAGASGEQVYAVAVEAALDGCPLALHFVLHKPGPGGRPAWFKSRGANFSFRLQPPRVSPLRALREGYGAGEGVRVVQLELEEEHGCDAVVRREAGVVDLELLVDRPGLVLHWGQARQRRDWRLPAREWMPAGSTVSGIACESAFPAEADERGVHALHLRFPVCADLPHAIVFIFRDATAPNRWIKTPVEDGHFWIELPKAELPAPSAQPAPREPAAPEAPKAPTASTPSPPPAPAAPAQEAPEVGFEALEAGPGEEEVAGGLLEIDGLRGKLTARLFKAAGRVRAVLSTPEAGLVLHWGVSPRARHEWVYAVAVEAALDGCPSPSTSSSTSRAPAGAPPGAAEAVEWTAAALDEEAGAEVLLVRGPERHRVRWVTDRPGTLLHWSLAPRRHALAAPPPEMQPPGSRTEGAACMTPFPACDGRGLAMIEVTVPAKACPRGLAFFFADAASPQVQMRAPVQGGCFFVALRGVVEGPRPGVLDAQMAERIIEGEAEAFSWTLMHRYNLCAELLPGAAGDFDKMALLYAWLRFSFIRQLDWQRNYNTQPRILAAAQDGLTMQIAQVYRTAPGTRQLARMMLPMLGKGGGNGQRIRDEILNIMHRHRLPEDPNTFLEQWHQKLHNNTTPDDVPICEAYLAFLCNNGSLDAFWGHLASRGLDRAKLAAYERPIRCDPAMHWHCKDGLVWDMNEYLRILKSVHCGGDLEVVSQGARYCLDHGMNQHLDSILWNRGHWDNAAQLERITSFRRKLRGALEQSEGHVLRDLLFLDAGMEEAGRLAVEALGAAGDLEQQLHAAGLVLENACLSLDDAALWDCLHELNRLKAGPLKSGPALLHLKACTDRMRTALGALVDLFQGSLQPQAAYLALAFSAEAWVAALFTEEVLRGSPLFALSAILRRMDPALRRRANLGSWQIISPGRADVAPAGLLEVHDELRPIQHDVYQTPTTVLVRRITGEEEIPEGVTAVITADAPDILSHVAVRARNLGVLFATCFCEHEYETLRGLAGRTLLFSDTGRGEVAYEEIAPGALAAAPKPRLEIAPKRHAGAGAAESGRWCLRSGEFSRELLGGKSNNLEGLRGRLPDWVRFPAAVALPFGSCERALRDEANGAAHRAGRELLAALRGALGGGSPAGERRGEAVEEQLGAMRALIEGLEAPGGLREELEACLRAEGLELAACCSWEEAWAALRRVWASKWNSRAFVAGRKAGLDPTGVRMAVLVMAVVPAEYAFVIHTTNPFTKDAGEIYAELCVGLGEALVGNFPGRALSFAARKRRPGEAPDAPRLLGFPSKLHCLRSRNENLIFRSDSNGEDLEGYAGAGLYDSVLAGAPALEVVRHADERLLWDDAFRARLLHRVVEIGALVEAALGSPQDIEGCFANGHFYIVQTRPQV